MSNLVAVYGSLRQGFGNHRLLEYAEYIGGGKTVDKFQMYSLGGFPAIVEGGDTSPTVEVYSVSDADFARLDRLEGYPDFYNRMQVDVETPRGVIEKCWIYYHEDTPMYHAGLVDSGDWRMYLLQQ